MGQFQFSPPLETTHDERTNAMLAHLLTIFAGFIAPGVIYFAKGRESRFVAFHALQAVFWHLFLFAVASVAGVVCFIVMFATTFSAVKGASGGGPPVVFFLGFLAIWLIMMLTWAINVGFCIYLAIQSNSGRWTQYPLAGALAKRFVRIPDAR